MKWTANSTWVLLAAGAAAIAVTLCVGWIPSAIAADAQAPAVAAAAKPVTPPATTAQPSPVPGEAGMHAYIDPETGKITSTPPAGVQPLSEPAAENAPVLQEERLPDGSYMIDLKGTLQDYMVLRLDANGKQVTSCSEDPKAALQTPPPAPQREDR